MTTARGRIGVARAIVIAVLGAGALLSSQVAIGAPVQAASASPHFQTQPMIPVLPSRGPAGTAESMESNGFQTAENWSGYALSGSTYTAVTGCWTVPTVTYTSGDTYSSDWIGIDGDNNDDLIQTGTEQDWSGGVEGPAQYSAWWEILPPPKRRSA